MLRSPDSARPWLTAVVAGAMVLVVGACGLPDGVDGDLTGDWGGFPEPVGFVPAAGECHEEPFRQTVPRSEYRPVDCDEPHLLQSVHVGSFAEEAEDAEDADEAGEADEHADADADAGNGDGADEDGAPPPAGSAELRQAYQQCEEQAAEFLGAGFRHGRLWLGVATPSEEAWQGGARRFRCDLMEVESVYGDPVERQGSLAGALAEDSDLALGCFTVEVEDGEVAQMSPVSCDEPHQAEFVGVWEAPDGPYPDFSDSDAEDEVYEGCREQVAEYADVPVDGDLVFRTGTIADWMSEQDWEAGDRAFRCYLWLPDRDLTESLAGAGTDGLPVRTEE